jgi:hypothetical protein
VTVEMPMVCETVAAGLEEGVVICYANNGSEKTAQRIAPIVDVIVFFIW